MIVLDIIARDMNKILIVETVQGIIKGLERTE